jgi:hypothetical protein
LRAVDHHTPGLSFSPGLLLANSAAGSASPEGVDAVESTVVVGFPVTR